MEHSVKIQAIIDQIMELDIKTRETLLLRLSKLFQKGDQKSVSRKKEAKNLLNLAGTWSNEEYEQFKRNTKSFEDIDDELWK